MVLRKGIPGDVERVRAAIKHLRLARAFLHCVGATKAADKVRRALKSAEGAERHALRCEPLAPHLRHT